MGAQEEKKRESERKIQRENSFAYTNFLHEVDIRIQENEGDLLNVADLFSRAKLLMYLAWKIAG